MARELTVEADELEGRYQILLPWMRGEDDGIEVELDQNMSTGHLVISVKKDGRTQREAIDMRPLMEDWAQGILDEWED